jgi:ATP-dependent DNA helicase RecG
MTTHMTKSPVLLELLQQWLEAKEGEQFEFKEARNRFSFEELCQYCCALANEGGGRILLGVTDKRPRAVVGSQAFSQPEETRRALTERLHLNVDFHEISHDAGRVLVFEVPSRPFGLAIKYDGIYWARVTDKLVPMSEDRLRSIFAESGHDFTADVCSGAAFSDLDSKSIEDFRRRWILKSKNQSLATLPLDQLLHDIEVITDNGITYAAIILFGTHQAVGKFLAQSEVVFEYRSSEVSGPAQQRKEFRQGFFSYYDDLWNLINLRNNLQHYQDGLFILDIPTFSELTVREAVLNAISHRNYQLSGNIFVRQYQHKLLIESPGGFPWGINVDNILDRQNPRNRRIAEVLSKCGLVERSGQGVNLMFEESIQQGKQRPDFSGTDQYTVILNLNGQMQEPRFVHFLQRIGEETAASFNTHDFLALDLIHKDEPIPTQLQTNVKKLLEYGVVERVGRGKGTKYILSRRLHSTIGKKGVYTRKRGLDRETNKQLLLKHISDMGNMGANMQEFLQVLPALSRLQINRLLNELKDEGLIQLSGSRKNARWFLKDGYVSNR